MNSFDGDPNKPLKNGMKQNEGWGNQVKIKDSNGNEHWLSHLASADVQEGQVIAMGDVIGTQGNTGRTYGKTGTHLDYTIKKPDGSYFTPKEVEQRIYG